MVLKITQQYVQAPTVCSTWCVVTLYENCRGLHLGSSVCKLLLIDFHHCHNSYDNIRHYNCTTGSSLSEMK